jgi:ribosomal protein S18 acetylase RimI-like enzyme
MTTPNADGHADSIEEGYRPMLQNAGAMAERIVPATEDDWRWIVQGQIEIAWARLGAKRREQEDRRDIAQKVERQVSRLRQDDTFASQAFVAWTSEERRAGFVWVAKRHSDTTGNLEAWLLNQYVSEPCRGEGLGKRLMEVAEGWAREQALPRISLCVGMHNAIGQRIYKSLGYEVETVRMSKSLTGEASDELRLDIY